MKLSEIEQCIKNSGFTFYAPIKLEQIVFEKSLRALCEMNSCGKYGKSHSCPPNIGDIESCIEKVKQFDLGFIFQHVGNLEDSYDFEGMMKEQDVFQERCVTLRKMIDDKSILLLGAGPCCLCEKCTKSEGAPCRQPEKMIASVEAHGIFVNPTLVNAGLKYNNGENTVSYVGIVMKKN